MQNTFYGQTLPNRKFDCFLAYYIQKRQNNAKYSTWGSETILPKTCIMIHRYQNTKTPEKHSMETQNNITKNVYFECFSPC